ncbi:MULTISPECIES: DUF2162 family putative transporter [Methanobrevibacter]|uniref:DUF2162 family putative transporter n=1 Tax=Methanobrevibacter TaxID=2172 RepID=UPI0025DA514F|nr:MULTISPECIES: DUF2162 family putative transporter [Methanobrevibacter]MCI7428822.1 DUF2162 domain-containing protein [Methanobrevibacter sp.]MDY3096759.1 DUF2162 family putative transporter [Methanobrevibacter sp.]
MGFNILWSVAFIVSILIFSVIIGLFINCNIDSKRNLAKLSIVSFISVGIFVYLISIFKIQLDSLIGEYNYILLFLIAFLLMAIGYIILKQKDYKKTFLKVLLLSYVSFILSMMICIGFGESIFGLDDLQISLLTTVVFNLLIIGISYVKINYTYRNFGSMYFILGIYCLMISLLLPNIISLNMSDMKPINIVSIDSAAFSFVLLVIIVVLGLLYYKKNSLLKK